MTGKDLDELKGIVQRQERGYTATLYGDVTCAEYTKEVDDMYLSDLIKKYGLLQIVSKTFTQQRLEEIEKGGSNE